MDADQYTSAEYDIGPEAGADVESTDGPIGSETIVGTPEVVDRLENDGITDSDPSEDYSDRATSSRSDPTWDLDDLPDVDEDYLSENRQNLERADVGSDGISAIWISRRPGDGSGTKEDATQDEDASPFPDDVPDDTYVSAATTFRSKDIDSWYDLDVTRYHVSNDRMERQRWTDLYLIQHGLDSGWHTDGLDQRNAGYRLEDGHRKRFHVCVSLAGLLDVDDDVRSEAITLATLGVGGDDDDRGPNAWNRHYGGASGLILAHVVRIAFDDPESVRESRVWPQLVECCDSMGVRVDKLVDRAFELPSDPKPVSGGRGDKTGDCGDA